MTNWTTFGGIALVVLFLLLALARMSQSAVSDHGESPSNWVSDPSVSTDVVGPQPAEQTLNQTPQTERTYSQLALLVNVAFSQGLFGLILLVGVWYAEIPLSALGLTGEPMLAVGIGVLTGLGLYAGSAIGTVTAAQLGYDYDERLRDLLTPESPGSWLLLLGGVLPVIAGFEELLFRAALIGVPSALGGIDPWFLAGGSSVAFAFGHGAQGRLGILVTGILGFVLASVFIVSNSLLAVVTAHYLVNALEFIVSGAWGIEWTKN